MHDVEGVQEDKEYDSRDEVASVLAHETGDGEQDLCGNEGGE